jgi:hypothetical protein
MSECARDPLNQTNGKGRSVAPPRVPNRAAVCCDCRPGAALAADGWDHPTADSRHASSIVLEARARLKRGTFAGTFFLAVIAALELEGVRLEDF